jgi:hypothetical protein
MPSWPSTIPTFLVSGFSEEPGDGRLRTPMDAGPPKVRRRFTATVTKMRGTIQTDDAGLAAFRTFLNTTTLGGSLPFDWEHPITGDAIVCQFGESLPRWSPANRAATRWDIDLDLEILP